MKIIYSDKLNFYLFITLPACGKQSVCAEYGRTSGAIVNDQFE